MALHVYNTLGRSKEEFVPLEEGKVRMYVCGPTVYDQAHVGHAMSSIVFDVIRRYLEYRGYQVRHVMNYTDVDDKVINRAKEIGADPIDLAQKYIAEYDRHLVDLGVLPAAAYPRVSNEIETIIEMVHGLVEKGFAYEVDGDVYFRVQRDEDYGKLSGRKLEDMRAGARLEVDERKEDPADFALWKNAKPGEPQWDSPWGPGRPGWHIECSAMSLRYLGERIDIHGGGNDLVFPHHENEIAQTESLTGKPFAQYWLHNGMMQLGGSDMSKSTGNVYTIESFLEHYEADVLRFLILNSQYRTPLAFNEEVVQGAANGLDRLRGGLRVNLTDQPESEQAKSDLPASAEAARAGFEQAMDDDFNTPVALSHLFELVRSIHRFNSAGAGVRAVQEAQDVLVELAGVLGLSISEDGASGASAAPFIDLLLEIREELRAAKQFELADRIRDRLENMGVAVQDHKDGTSWRLH